MISNDKIHFNTSEATEPTAAAKLSSELGETSNTNAEIAVQAEIKLPVPPIAEKLLDDNISTDSCAVSTPSKCSPSEDHADDAATPSAVANVPIDKSKKKQVTWSPQLTIEYLVEDTHYASPVAGTAKKIEEVYGGAQKKEKRRKPTKRRLKKLSKSKTVEGLSVRANLCKDGNPQQHLVIIKVDSTWKGLLTQLANKLRMKNKAMKKSRLYVEGEPLNVTNFAAKLSAFKSWETPLIKVATTAGGGSQSASGGLKLSKKQVKAMSRKELCAHLRSIGASCDGNKKVLMRQLLERMESTPGGEVSNVSSAKSKAESADPDPASEAATAHAPLPDTSAGLVADTEKSSTSVSIDDLEDN